MQHITLLPLDLCYTNVIFELSSDPHIKNALGITVENIEDTKTFLLFAIEEERQKKSLSRMIVNEENEIIGLTTLKHINNEKSNLTLVVGLAIHTGEKAITRLLKKKSLKSPF
ncbi:GNAT family acetyltransferase [Bacillus thuringiensis serovar tolworthi]|uniref:GNAT family acetyltransferase n=1 Tax=Bacillus thuringiensis subsp. tolworthi TaxID=1442 RepID=A0A9W3ZT24_BACTO|nr:hypothetical protein IIE_00734 [Bacillus cereus VD045]BAR82419.1 GNAT family acetyltransferase [Bacillus thuringiensis serovar tolworthi]